MIEYQPKIGPPIFGVCILITDKDKVLGVTRKDDHNDWGLPGGKIDPDEFPLDACSRELLEETGLSILDKLKVITLYDGYCLSPVTGLYRRVITYYTAKDNISGTINSNESGLVNWVSWEKVMSGSFGYYNVGVATAFSYQSLVRKQKE